LAVADFSSPGCYGPDLAVRGPVRSEAVGSGQTPGLGAFSSHRLGCLAAGSGGRHGFVKISHPASGARAPGYHSFNLSAKKAMCQARQSGQYLPSD